MAEVIDISSAKTRSDVLKSGGGDGTFDPMEARVEALEKKFDKIDAKLDAIASDLAYVKGKTDSAPSAKDFGELKGRVDSLPTTAKAATLLTLAVTGIAIINNWQLIKATLLHP